MARPLLLDTHALLWWFSSADLLSARATRATEEAETLLISPISFWEVAMLVAKDRIELDRPTGTWLNDVLGDAAGELADFHGDPADRLLVATAHSLDVPLLTKDHKIRAWADDHRRISCVW